jgi:hypothetical protein
MTKAFKRIDAGDLETAMDNGELPEALVIALRDAITNARSNDKFDGEVPIQVFITDDREDDDE